MKGLNLSIAGGFGFRKNTSNAEKRIRTQDKRQPTENSRTADIFIDFDLVFWYKRYSRLTPAVFV